jgi:hypothetical protein
MIKDVAARSEVVMATIQETLRGADLQWFHPTPDLIVAGNVATKFFVAIQARRTSPTTMAVEIRKASGDDTLMLSLCRRIQDAIEPKT